LEPHHNLPRLETELRFGPEAAPREGKQFWIRAGAYLIDVVVFYGLHVLAMGATAFALGVLLSLAGHELRLYRGTCCMDYVVPGVLSVVYFAIFESLYGASLGKVLLRMRVIMVSGERCTLGAALVRSLVRYVDGFLFGIPAYVIMQAPLYQRIGDKSAKTIVVGAGDPTIRGSRSAWWFLIALALYVAADCLGSLALIGLSSIGP
jgi:uncharacterized RDD family membrane protein YckC